MCPNTLLTTSMKTNKTKQLTRCSLRVGVQRYNEHQKRITIGHKRGLQKIAQIRTRVAWGNYTKMNISSHIIAYQLPNFAGVYNSHRRCIAQNMA